MNTVKMIIGQKTLTGNKHATGACKYYILKNSVTQQYLVVYYYNSPVTGIPHPGLRGFTRDGDVQRLLSHYCASPFFYCVSGKQTTDATAGTDSINRRRMYTGNSSPECGKRITAKADRRLTSAGQHLTSAERHLTSAGNVLTSVERHLTSGEQTLTSVERHLTSAEQTLTSAGQHLTSVDRVLTSAGRHLTSGTVRFSFVCDMLTALKRLFSFIYKNSFKQLKKMY
jgi:hypothetical protein